MNLISQWAEDLARIPELAHSPDVAVTPAKMTRDEVTASSVAELNEKLAAIGEVHGWLLEASAVRELRDAPVVPEGIPLDGEWQRGNEHWQLEFVGDDQWCLYRYELQTENVSEPTHLAEKRYQQLADRKGRLVYWCLWQPDDEDDNRPPVQRLALFAGFED